MSDSILDSIKHLLGIAPDYDFFDPGIIMNINSAFASLHLVGVGPDAGFEIADDTAVWADFLGNKLPLNSVRQYVFYSVKLAFDPPATSFGTTAMQEQIQKLEWTLNVVVDGNTLVPGPSTDATVVYDGGTP